MAEVSRFESLIDQQIRLAQERGDFENLPGAGKPLPGRGRPDDDLWWLRGYLEREGASAQALLPTPLRLAREIEQLPGAVADLPSEQVVRERARDLNRRIAEYLRAPSGPHVPLRPVDPDDLVDRWRSSWQAPGDSEAADRTRDQPGRSTGGPSPAGSQPAGSPRPRRRRWLGRRHAA